MMKHQRGAVRTVMDMSLFLLFLLSGLLCSKSGFQRKYYYINQIMSWSAAQSYCRENYTDLATVDSIDNVNEMLNTVNDGYNGSVWIGLKKVTLKRWVWSNGDDTLAQYSNWGPGNPNGTINCGYFAKGFWYNFNCSTPMLFACYNESTGYIKGSHSKNWTDAWSYCRQYHTDLATISSDEEQKHLQAIAGDRSSIWIGLMVDTWQWSDKWSRYFRYWADGYPRNASRCVAMSTAGSRKWVNYRCYQQYPFFCYNAYKKHIIRLNLSCDGKCDLNDPSLQTATMKEIHKKLQSMGLGNYISLTWRESLSISSTDN